MKNKLKYIPILLILFILSIVPVIAAYIPGQITNVSIKRTNDIVYIEADTVGFTSKMDVIIKILDDEKNLQYLNTVSVKDGKIVDFFTPANIENDTYLDIIFDGDLAYTTRYFYSKEYNSETDKNSDSLLKALQDYQYYKDNNSKYALEFEVSYDESLINANVYLRGKNFVSGDNLWKNKDEKTWKDYLQLIKTLAFNSTGKKKNIIIYVYDKKNVLVCTYPVENLNEDIVEKPIEKSEIINSMGEELSYTSNGNALNFTATLVESNNKYAKIKFTGDFYRTDDVWKNSSLVDLEKFSREMSLKIKDKFLIDLDFNFYDKNSRLLESYSYYYYNNSIANQGNTIGSEVPTITPVPDKPTITPTPNNPSEPNYNEIGLPGEEQNNGSTTHIGQYKAWKPTDDAGIRALSLMVYSYNSGTVNPTRLEEGMEGATYKYNYALDNYNDVNNCISYLRNDSKKVLVCKLPTLGNNVNFKITSDIVDLLKANDVTFVFDSSSFKFETDFGKLNVSGEYVINTNETIAMVTNKATPAINFNATVGGQQINTAFSDGAKLALHYVSNDTKDIPDLRFVNIYHNNSTMLNTTVENGMKAFICKYVGNGVYYGRANTYICNDSNFEDNMYRRYAELVVSKGIMSMDGSVFNPKKTMTRGEFVDCVAKKLAVSSNINYFSDLSNGSPYFYSFNGAYEYGILPSVWTNGSNIDKKITIEEMVYIVTRCYEINQDNPTQYGNALYYIDSEDISTWAKNEVAIAARIGLIPSDGYLYPRENGTREDAAELLFNLLHSEGIF